MIRVGVFSAVLAFGYAAASSTQYFEKLFDELSKSGCQSCVDEGYGWNSKTNRCGGFANSNCNQGSKIKSRQEGQVEPAKTEVEKNAAPWEDTSTTTLLWQLISTGNMDGLLNLLQMEPETAMVRSTDGRGPLFWAKEYGNSEIIALLVKNGASMKDQDQDGKVPSDMQRAAVRVPSSASPKAALLDNDDDDFDIFEDSDSDDAALEGYASAGEVTTPAQTREEYVELLEKLTALGCEACVGANFGWSKSRLRCGGFESSDC